MSTSTTMQIGFFFSFKEATYSEIEKRRGCYDQTGVCENSKYEKWVKVRDYDNHDKKKFCELCGSEIKETVTTKEVTSGKAGNILHYVTTQMSSKDGEQLRDIMFAPEYAPDQLAVLNLGWDGDSNEPDFMTIDFAEENDVVSLSAIKQPKLPPSMEAKINWAIEKINGTFGKEIVKLDFGVMSYTF